MKKRRKTSNKKKLQNKLDKLVKDFVKKRDNYTCQKCGKETVGQNCHPSHVLSAGAYPNLKYAPINIKVLCFYCHRMWWHMNPLEASEWFKDKFPERQMWLNEWKNVPSLATEAHLERMIKQYEEADHE